MGQSQWEEVDVKPAGPAGGYNFGWSCYEGNHFTGDYYNYFDNSTCLPASAYDAAAFEYTHSTGDCSITGGFVYRSPSYLDLPGNYFYSDYCRPSIRTLSGSIGNFTPTEVLPQSQFAAPSTFGENVIGDLYVANMNAGTVHRINGTNPRPTSAIVKKAATAPAIDGVVDPVWANANEYSMNNNVVRGSGVWFHKDLWSTFRALYDQTNLYVLVEVQDDLLVTDSTAWYDDDDIEIMIDGDRSGGNTYDGNNDFEFGYRWNDPEHHCGRELGARAGRLAVCPGVDWHRLSRGDPAAAGRDGHRAHQRLQLRPGRARQRRRRRRAARPQADLAWDHGRRLALSQRALGGDARRRRGRRVRACRARTSCS